MREYLIKRFVLLIPTFIGITLVVYAVLLLLPGDPVDVLLGQEYDPVVAQRLRAEWGLDQPILVQYTKWLWHILQGDWGQVDVFTQTRARRDHGQVAPHPGAGRPGPLL